MNNTLFLVMAGAAGLLLGIIFFGGLWWTVQKALSSKRPELWFIGGFIFRTGLVLFGLYVVCGIEWERWLVSLALFIFARFAVLRVTRRMSIKPVQRVRFESAIMTEASHANQS
jgi:F1F0 ATPase subunit 2